MSRIHRLTTTAGTVLVVATLGAAGPAWAQSQDLRSPDAREASVAASTTPGAQGQDPRSADARDAGIAGTTSATHVQDLRTPDARAAGEGTPVVVHVEPAADDGMSWDSAAVGALIAAGALISLAGIAALVSRRRTRPAV
jgi:hypothetical protein